MLELVAPSRFRAVVVVPVFNHPAKIGALVRAIRSAGLRCVVVDDGSDASCAAILDAIAVEHGIGVVLVRLQANLGKGGAVMAGLRQAAREGYSHAVQIDADMQHNPDDIGRFIALARRRPDAIICGSPVFDASAPLARRIGRTFTRVTVWINTWSFAIRDSMCGLRVYPLASVVRLLDRVQFGQRMSFDTEVLVQSHWRGIEIVNIATEVKYPHDGISHFRMVLDNWLIARMHARLFVGMLIRTPTLFRRRLLSPRKCLYED
jgi:glycosyltransferase involved in cell wall biosynthesis